MEQVLHPANLRAGMTDGGELIARGEGTPQGGPLSPLLANLLLDRLDKELARRDHQFVRYADDCNRKAEERFKDRIRALTQRTRGRSLRQVVAELRVYLRGWGGYFGLAPGRNRLRELSAWNSCKSAHVVWRLSRKAPPYPDWGLTMAATMCSVCTHDGGVL